MSLREKAEPMIMPLLDALLPPTSAKSAFQSLGHAESGAFEAMLAGLNASAATLPGNPLVAASGAVLPPTGKTWPQLFGTVADGAFGDLPLDPSSDEPGDWPVLSGSESEAIFPSSGAPDAIALAPVASLALPVAAALVPPPASLSPASPPPASAPSASPIATSATPPPAPALQLASDQIPTGQPAPDTARKIAGRAQFVPPSGLAPPAVMLDPEPRASGANPVPASADAPKPGPQPTSTLAMPTLAMATLAILPTVVRPSATGAASPPLRRGLESKVDPVSLASAPELSPAAPVAIVAAPVTAAPGSALPDAPTTSAQPPVQQVALPDHRALVEALVRARVERDPGVSVALDTREFGAVALRFETLQTATGERAWQVALSSGDPGFDRAVASAAAAQAALADQSGRNPANRPDPAPVRSAEQFGDAGGGRASSSDPQAQQRPATPESWRESRSRHPGETSFLGEGGDAAAPRPDRRRGSIFA